LSEGMKNKVRQQQHRWS